MNVHNGFPCRKCGKTKPITEFHKDKSKSRGHQTKCKACVYEANQTLERKKARKEAAKRHRQTQRYRDWRKEYEREYLKRPEVIARKAKKDRTRRLDTIEKLGGKCECCGETSPYFLAIDHINGKSQRRRKETGNILVNKVIKESYPKDKYRVLCHNCNSALGFYGFCPHQTPDIDYVTRPIKQQEES